MNRTEWLACRDPLLMLHEVRQRASQRKLRLFACACVRRHIEFLAARVANSRELLAATENFSDTGSGSLHEAVAPLLKGLGFYLPYILPRDQNRPWPVVLSVLEEDAAQAIVGRNRPELEGGANAILQPCHASGIDIAAAPRFLAGVV